MRKILIIPILFLTMFGFATAQSGIQIMDLAVYPAIETDSTGIPLDTNTISYNLNFKINRADLAGTVHIQVGTTQDSGDILSNTASIEQQNGQYSISGNGSSTPINGYKASIKLDLTRQQEEASRYITLYVVDNQGQETGHLYFKK